MATEPKIAGSADAEDGASESLFALPTEVGTSNQSAVDIGDPNPLGDTTEHEVAALVNERFGDDPELTAAPISIAIEALAKAISARTDHADAHSDPRGISIFILSERPRDLALRVGAISVPIIDNGSCAFSRKLWIVGPALHSGYSKPLAADEAGSIFEEVIGAGLGNLPAFVFDPSATAPEIRHYPNGLSDADIVKRFALSDLTFDLAALDAVLSLFHSQNLITPDASKGELSPWNDAAKYYPRAAAEAFFQDLLRLALRLAFRRLTVKFEVPGTEGRCDLLVLSQQGGTARAWMCHAALELKVLKSFHSTGSVVSGTERAEAIRSGVLQAAAYKTENDASFALLCCYDMRRKSHYDADVCFDPCRALAAANSVLLRRYRLYGSSGDFREERYGD